jgi:hypothetical protein
LTSVGTERSSAIPRIFAGTRLLRQIGEFRFGAEQTPAPQPTDLHQPVESLRLHCPDDAEKHPPASLDQGLLEQHAPPIGAGTLLQGSGRMRDSAQVRDGGLSVDTGTFQELIRRQEAPCHRMRQRAWASG